MELMKFPFTVHIFYPTCPMVGAYYLLFLLINL